MTKPQAQEYKKRPKRRIQISIPRTNEPLQSSHRIWSKTDRLSQCKKPIRKTENHPHPLRITPFQFNGQDIDYLKRYWDAILRENWLRSS